jgi:hypothetical protein
MGYAFMKLLELFISSCRLYLQMALRPIARLLRGSQVNELRRLIHRYSGEEVQDQLFAVIHVHNWESSFLELTKAWFPHSVMQNGAPDSKAQKCMRELIRQFELDKAWPDHEIVTNTRPLRRLNGKEVDVNVLGILDNEKDADQAIARYDAPFNGWKEKIGRVNDIKANIRGVKHTIRKRQMAIDARTRRRN